MEGPQTRTLAEHLNELLTGKPVERILVPPNRWQANVLLLNCVGQVIQRIRSYGKWIFFDFSHGVTWMCQLITRSKWVIVQPGTIDAPKNPARSSGSKQSEPLISLYLRNGSNEGDSIIAILKGRPIFYILPTEKVRHHPDIQLLGPDPLASATFHDDFPYRLRQTPGRTVAAALLDQEVVAGLGNILKCEILYEMRFTPSIRIGMLLASQVDRLSSSIVALAATASTFATQGKPFPYRVFDRAGLPCPTCATEIQVDRSGQDAHLSWHCPYCQNIGVENSGHEPMLFR